MPSKPMGLTSQPDSSRVSRYGVDGRFRYLRCVGLVDLGRGLASCRPSLYHEELLAFFFQFFF